MAWYDSVMRSPTIGQGIDRFTNVDKYRGLRKPTQRGRFPGPSDINLPYEGKIPPLVPVQQQMPQQGMGSPEASPGTLMKLMNMFRNTNPAGQAPSQEEGGFGKWISDKLNIFHGSSSPSPEKDSNDEVIEIDDDGNQTQNSGPKDINLPYEGKKKIVSSVRKKPNKGLKIPSLPDAMEGLSTIPGNQMDLMPGTYAQPEIQDEPTPIMDAYRNRLLSMPNRSDYTPSKMDRLVAFLTGIGGGDPAEARDRRYNEATSDWLRSNSQLNEGAKLEDVKNDPNRSLKAMNTISQIHSRENRDETYGQRGDAYIRSVDARIKSYENQGWQKVVNDDGDVYMVRGNQVVPTGLSALEYSRYLETKSYHGSLLDQGRQRIGQGDKRIEQGDKRNNALYGGDQ
jgi:hypothetical protein